MSKQCRMCSRTRPLDAFNRAAPKHSAVLRTICKDCQRVRRRAIYWADPEAARAYAREWKAQNLHRMPHYGRRRRHGIEPEQWEAMREAQGDRCAICQAELVLKIDHCHASGAIRGLLCDRCNRGLGFFDDDPVKLAAAAAYVASGGDPRCRQALSMTSR